MSLISEKCSSVSCLPTLSEATKATSQTKFDRHIEKGLMSCNERKIVLKPFIFTLLVSNFSHVYSANDESIREINSSHPVQTNSTITDVLQIRKINGNVQNHTSNDFTGSTINDSDFHLLKSAVTQNNDGKISFTNSACNYEPQYVKKSEVDRATSRNHLKQMPAYSLLNYNNQKKDESEDSEYDYFNVDGDDDDHKRETFRNTIAAENSKRKTVTDVLQHVKRAGKQGQIWDQWGKWSCCNTSCGPGKIMRWRHCVAGGCAAGEKEAQLKSCQIQSC